MSGENFYGRQTNELKQVAAPPFSTEPKVPLVNGAPGADRLPTFTTFDPSRRPYDDERRLLDRTTSSTRSQGIAVDSRDDGSDRYGPPRSRSKGRYDGPRDEFGNPIPSSNALAPMPLTFGRVPGTPLSPEGYSNDQVGSLEPPRSTRGRGYGPPRVRGGYVPRRGYGPTGFGYNGPRGPPPQGYAGRGGRFIETRGSYNSRGRGGYPSAALGGAAAVGVAAGAMMDRQQRALAHHYPPQGTELPTDGYDRFDVTTAGGYPRHFGSSDHQDYAAYGPRPQSPSGQLRSRSHHSNRRPPSVEGLRSASMPPPLHTAGQESIPVGQAVEMDASTGTASPLPFQHGGSVGDMMDGEAEARGMASPAERDSTYSREDGVVPKPTNLSAQEA